jgi:hypothetical protein
MTQALFYKGLLISQLYNFWGRLSGGPTLQGKGLESPKFTPPVILQQITISTWCIELNGGETLDAVFRACSLVGSAINSTHLDFAIQCASQLNPSGFQILAVSTPPVDLHTVKGRGDGGG